MSVQSWLNSIWYDRTAPPWWLVPLSLTYGAVSGSRRFLYIHHLRKASRISCPVVVVGNVSVGGTGKTPLVCWLAAHLADRGYKPGIVTRGYGGSSRDVRRITAADDPNVVGDESILLARRSGAPVAIGRDRPAAAQLLVGDGCNVIVSDDGLQHYALARDCEVVVIDGDRRFGNGWLLPAGPLREPLPRELPARTLVVYNAATASTSLPGTLIRRSLAGLVPLDAWWRGRPAAFGGSIDSLRGRTVVAAAGLAHPQRFFRMLREFGLTIEEMPLPDHFASKTQLKWAGET